MKLRLLNNIDTLKSTDNATKIEMSVINESEEVIDLSQYTSIGIAIGYQGTRYSSETPLIADDNKSLSIVLSNALPEGKYNVEVILTKEDGTYHIAPNEGVFILTIEKSLSEVGTSVTVISVQQLIDDMAEVRRLSEQSNANVTEALNNINELLEHVGETNATDVKVADEDNLYVSENVEGVLKEIGYHLSNDETPANKVKLTDIAGNFATDDAESALAELASKVNATIPASEKGVANGVARLNEEGKVIDSDGNVVSGSGGGSDVDLSEYAKTSDVDTKDATILQSAKDYTDSKAGGTTEVTKESIGLGNVDNTSDLDKPISSATQRVLDDINAMSHIRAMPTEDLDSLRYFGDEGFYKKLSGYLDGAPLDTMTKEAIVQVIVSDDETEAMQVYREMNTDEFYVRYFANNSWSVWRVNTSPSITSTVPWLYSIVIPQGMTNELRSTQTYTNYPYSAGQGFAFKCPSMWNPTDGDINLNINGLGAKSIKNTDGTTPTLYPNAVYTVRYDGTANFILQGEGGGVNGVAYADGTTTSNATSALFQYVGNTNTSNLNWLEVSELGFEPNLIIIQDPVSGYDFTVYKKNIVGYTKVVTLVPDTNTSTTDATRAYKADMLNAYVNASGFKLPVKASGHTYKWQAWG